MKTFLIIFTFCVLSCSEVPLREEKQIHLQETSSERIDRQNREALSEFYDQLNFPRITDRIDSFELRIMVPTDTISILSIRYTNSKWRFSKTYIWETYFKYDFHSKDTTNYLKLATIDSSKTYNLLPRIPVATLVDSLRAFLSIMPKVVDIGGPSTQGRHYIFELSTKDKYSYQRYYCNGRVLKGETDHIQFENIINLLRRHLDSNMPKCN